MRTNSFNANAIGGRGGLFDSGAQAIKDALLAYFQSKRNERQDQRQLRRDERQMGRQQQQDAVVNAERFGVRPAVENAGWLPPDAVPLIDAAVRQHTQNQEQAGQARSMAELQQRAQRLKLAEGMGPEGLTPGASEAEIIAAQRGAQERALSLKRQGVSDQLNNVRLKQEQDQAVWDSVPGRAVRGVGQWVGDTVQEAVKAAGRQKPTDGAWRQGDMGFMSRDMGNGFSASRDPAGNVTIVGPTGETLTPEKYQAMRASLGQAVGVGQPGVDINAPPAQPRAWSQDKELDFWAGYEADKIKKGTGQAAMRQWNGGNPTFNPAEMAYMKTLPQSEQVALANAMRSQDYKIRAIASLKLHDDAKAWSTTQGK